MELFRPPQNIGWRFAGVMLKLLNSGHDNVSLFVYISDDFVYATRYLHRRTEVHTDVKAVVLNRYVYGD